MKYWTTQFPYAYTYFVPLLHDDFLITTFEECKYVEEEDEELPKDIDILFLGEANDRTNNIINKLKENYLVVSIKNNSLDFYKLVYLMQRSKLVLNIFNTDDAPHFDYMKNSFLISNKIFFVSELPQDYNFSFEDNL